MALSAGSVEIRLFAELARLQSDMKKANKVVEDAMGGIQKTVRATTTIFNRLAGAFSASAIVKIADDYKRFDAQLKLSTKSLNEYNEAYANVIRIGRTAQSDIGAIGVLYARLNNNLRDFNVTQKQVSDVAETISLALRTNNATVQETNSVMLQLSQSFGSGKLNGQEFLAVAEGAPMLLRQLATSLKVPYGALKDLSAQGLITRDALLKAWSDPAYIASLREQVKQVGTVTSSITVLMNNLKQYIGEADKATSTTKILAGVIKLVADNINLLVTGALSFGVVKLAQWVSGTIASIAASKAKQVELIREAVLHERKAAAEAAASLVTQTSMANNAASTTAWAVKNGKAFTEAAMINAEVAKKMKETASASGVLARALNFVGGPLGAFTLGVGALIVVFPKLVDWAKSASERAYKMSDGYNGVSKSLVNVKKSIEDLPAFSLEKLFPDYKQYRKNLDDSLGLTKEINQIIPTGAKLTDNISFGKIGDISEKFKEIKDNFDAFAKANPLKDLTAQTEEYRAKLELLNKAREYGLAPVTLLNRYEAQLKEQYDKAVGVAKINKATNDANKEALEREAKVRKYLFDLQQELDGEVTKRYNQAVAIRAKDDKEEFERKSEMMKALQKQANENYKESQRVVEEQAKEVERVNNRLYNNLARSLTGSIVRGFEQGLSFIDNFKQTIKNAFKSFVVNVGVNFVQQGLQGLFGGLTGRLFASMGSAIASGSSLVDGSLSGGGSIFKDLGNILTTSNQSIIGGIESIGGQIANGLGGIRDTIGGYLGANASFVANALSYGGAVLQLSQGNWAGAIGTGIGTALGGPIGGAIGSFLGGAVGGLFGGKKIPRYSSQSETIYANGEFKTSTGTPMYKSLGANGATTDLNVAFTNMLIPLFEAFNVNDVIGTKTRLVQKRKSSYAEFWATINGVSAGAQGVKGSAKSTSATFQQLVDKVLGAGIANAIQSSSLVEGIKKLFIGLTDKTQVINMINAAISLNKANDALVDSFNITAEQTAKVAMVSGLAGDELIKVIASMVDAANASRTIGDALFELRNNLKDALGGTIYSSLTEFDNALKGIDKTTQAGIEAFYELFALRDEFSQFQTQIDNLKSGVRGALFGVVSESEQQAMKREDLAKMFADLNREVPASIQELIALGKSIDYTTAEGLNLALVFPALVDAFNQTEQGVKSLMGTLNASYFTTRADMLSANASDNPRAFVKGQAETNASLLAEIKQMKTDNADMKAIMAAVVEYTRQQQRIIDDWDVNGMPAVRVA